VRLLGKRTNAVTAAPSTTSVVDGAAGDLEPAVAVAVAIRGLGKRFPGVRALHDISFDVARGSVHALVGENGSGKSTLIRVLTGALTPDEGEVRVLGRPLHFGRPSQAKAAGIAAVHQELSLVPTLSVEENVCMADIPTRASLVDRGAMRAEYRALAERLSVDVPPGTLVGELSVADQSLLEIMRALRAEARIIILDEASAALGVEDRRRLHAIVRSFHQEGRTILFISHDLEEIMGLADHVTVLRDGEHVRTAAKRDLDKRGVVSAMLGDSVARVVLEGEAERPEVTEVTVDVAHLRDEQSGGASAGPGERPLLEVREVSLEGAIDRASFALRRGEILGVAGLMGSGRSSLLRALAGVAPGASGALVIDGKTRRVPHSVREALRLGIALLPEDRRTQGLVLSMDAARNATLTDLSPSTRAGFIQPRADRRRAREFLSRLHFAGNPDAPAGTLSGGNQQKVLMAKWLNRPPRIFLIDEPYRGIDIGAKREVLAAIRALAATGCGVVVVSSEFEEVVEISTRVLLLAEGRTIGELTAGDITVTEILERLFHVKEQQTCQP